MARALVVSNGQLAVTLDSTGFVRDVYFPYVGLENHVSGHKHRVGVSVNGVFSWLDDGSWDITVGYKPATMVGYLVCKNEKLKLSLVMEDAVYNETNVFLRQIEIYNHGDVTADIKLFCHQVFLISESTKRNTAFYDPTHNAIVHYKGRRVFIVNGRTEGGAGIDEYSVGAYQEGGKEGTWKDAEDSQLSKNAVEHGNVDSVIRFCTTCEGKSKAKIFYWICAAKSLDEAFTLNEMVMTKTPAAMLHSTEDYWRAWLTEKSLDLSPLSQDQQRLFEVSLFILRAHTDNRGSVIASADSKMIEYGKDDYSYMWPRDAAYIVSTLDQLGYDEATKPFFLFCKEVLHPDGYLHHRFRPDMSLGSTWHSTIAQEQWLKDRILQLPIQEDESAAVLVALWKHYEVTKNIELIEELYRPLIAKIADFLVSFRNPETGLPLYSYDLWEEKIGISTYTCAATYGGLQAASRFSELLGKRNHMRTYQQVAKELKEATIKHLFSTELDSFVRVGYMKDGQIEHEKIVDSSSLFGLWYFGMLEIDDPLLQATARQVEQRLQTATDVGGFIRYEHDTYFKDTDRSNPWIITTLWRAQERLSKDEVSDEDFEYCRQVFDWVIKHRYRSGVLAEQLNPYTAEARSATPLVWSHAVYVETVLWYLKALDRKKLMEQADRPVHEL